MLGDKIRKTRKAKGLTINELADQIKVTSGYISQIERDLIDPSMSVLRRISKALETPLSVLFSSEVPADVTIVEYDKRTTIKFGNVNMEYEYITPFKGKGGKAGNIEAFKFVLKPGQWSSTGFEINEAEECIWVIKGDIEYHTGESVYVAHEGDSVYVEEDKGHRLYNPGEVDAVGLCMLSPSVH